MLAAVADAQADLTQVHLGLIPRAQPCQCGLGAAGGSATQALGRSRGGFGTKLHVLVEAAGRLLRVRLTLGQAGDTPQARPLLAGLHPGHVMTDRAYDADPLRDFIVEQGGTPVIPDRHHCKAPIEHDRERNVVERGIGWLKQCRRLATRFEKTASSYLGPVMFVAVRHWLQNPFAR